jgi:hypothetical protein
VVQVTQLTNLVKTIFTIESEGNDNNGPLNRLMLLYVFPAKFVKGHLNAAFQSNDLKLAMMHKLTSINPFHYGPQNNQAMVIVARKEQEEEQNEKNFSIIETQCKKILSLIEGIGKINSMEDVAMTCASICVVQLAIINVASGKPLLYQYAYKMICAGMRTTRICSRICLCSSWLKPTSFFKTWHSSPRTALRPILLSTAPPATS